MNEWLPLIVLLVIWLGGAFGYAIYRTRLERRHPERGGYGRLELARDRLGEPPISNDPGGEVL